jgi:hypothetical protein
MWETGGALALLLFEVLPLGPRRAFIFGVPGSLNGNLYACRRALSMTRSLRPLRVHGPVQGPRPYNGMPGSAHPTLWRRKYR